MPAVKIVAAQQRAAVERQDRSHRGAEGDGRPNGTEGQVCLPGRMPYQQRHRGGRQGGRTTITDFPANRKISSSNISGSGLYLVIIASIHPFIPAGRGPSASVPSAGSLSAKQPPLSGNLCVWLAHVGAPVSERPQQRGHSSERGQHQRPGMRLRKRCSASVRMSGAGRS